MIGPYDTAVAVQSAMHVALFCAVIAFASLIQGIPGFSKSLLAVPLALIFLPKETVVSSSLMVRVSLNGYVSLPFP